MPHSEDIPVTLSAPSSPRLNKLYRSEITKWEADNILFSFYRFYPDKSFVTALVQCALKSGDYTAEWLGTPGKSATKGTWEIGENARIVLNQFEEQGFAGRMLGREPKITSSIQGEVFADRIVLDIALPNSRQISKCTLWLLV